jgi:hypothetical protein
MCTISHMTQAMKPVSFTLPRSATAANRATVAMLPLSW